MLEGVRWWRRGPAESFELISAHGFFLCLKKKPWAAVSLINVIIVPVLCCAFKPYVYFAEVRLWKMMDNRYAAARPGGQRAELSLGPEFVK